MDVFFFFLLNHGFALKHHCVVCVCVFMSVYPIYSSALLLNLPCVCCLCASFALHWECRTTLFLCLVFLINISLTLPPFTSPLFAASLILGHQNKVLSMLHHTPLKDWLARWNPAGTIWLASGAIKKLPPPDGCKQSFCCFFLTFIYSQ